MQHVTGQHLFTDRGEDIGEIVDVMGTGPDLEPSWLAVKTGWFATRLVPFAAVREQQGQWVTALTPSRVEEAPKVPPHFEPTGSDRDELLRHYGLVDHR